MSKRCASDDVGNDGPPKRLSHVDRIAFWEMRHARIRLALAENDIAWAQEALVAGNITAMAALQPLDAAMDDVAGVQP